MEARIGKALGESPWGKVRAEEGQIQATHSIPGHSVWWSEFREEATSVPRMTAFLAEARTRHQRRKGGDSTHFSGLLQNVKPCPCPRSPPGWHLASQSKRCRPPPLATGPAGVRTGSLVGPGTVLSCFFWLTSHPLA